MVYWVEKLFTTSDWENIWPRPWPGLAATQRSLEGNRVRAEFYDDDDDEWDE